MKSAYVNKNESKIVGKLRNKCGNKAEEEEKSKNQQLKLLTNCWNVLIFVAVAVAFLFSFFFIGYYVAI